MKCYDKNGYSIPQKGERCHVQLTLHHKNGWGSWGEYDVPYWVIKLIRIVGNKEGFQSASHSVKFYDKELKGEWKEQIKEKDHYWCVRKHCDWDGVELVAKIWWNSIENKLDRATGNFFYTKKEAHDLAESLTDRICCNVSRPVSH